MPTVRYLTILFALFLSMPAAAQIQYQFQDQPRPEADVVVVNHTLQVRGSADVVDGRPRVQSRAQTGA